MGYINREMGQVMTEGVKEFADAYLIVGFGGSVLLVLTLLLAVIWRSNARVKEDPTSKLLEVVKQGLDTNRELTTEFVQAGQRADAQSKAHVNVLAAIGDELKEGRKVQTGLVDVVQSVNRAVTDARADINALASTQATRDAALQGEVLTAITNAQTAIIKEFSALMVDAIKELKAAVLQLRYRRDTSKPVHKIINRLDAKIDQLSKDVTDYAKQAANAPIPPATPALGSGVPSDASKPLYAPTSASDPLYAPTPSLSNGRYPDANRWLRDGDK